jgi:hypothetical protein
MSSGIMLLSACGIFAVCIRVVVNNQNIATRTSTDFWLRVEVKSYGERGDVRDSCLSLAKTVFVTTVTTVVVEYHHSITT